VASVGVFVGCAATVRDDALEGALDDALAAADRALYDGKRRRGVLPFDDVRREPVPTFRSADEVPRPR
jgi:hypothetical protein